MKKPACFVIVVLILLLIINSICSGETVSKEDQEALLVFKSTVTSSDHQQILPKNWSTNESICAWIGVSSPPPPLDESQPLIFPASAFRQLLSLHLGNLTYLTSLDLSRNNFTGHIPPELFNLQRLRILKLGYNDLDGEIPQAIGNLSSLEILELTENSIKGHIPDLIFNMSSLQYVDLSKNSLSAGVPVSSICRNLPNLEHLRLATNQLTGNILDKMLDCKQLRIVQLMSNKFTGNIPNQIGNLTKLNELSIGYNNFTGVLRNDMFNNFTHLWWLSLSGNLLSGQIPSDIYKCNGLQFLFLDNNSLQEGCWPLDGGGVKSGAATI